MVNVKPKVEAVNASTIESKETWKKSWTLFMSSFAAAFSSLPSQSCIARKSDLDDFFPLFFKNPCTHVLKGSLL